MNKTTKKNIDRGKITLADLLESDRHQYPHEGVPNLTIAARDWLTKFIAGKPVPYNDSITPEVYAHIELIVAVMVDRGGVPGAMLPDSATDYVEEWLYRLEEATHLHVWNVADIARPFLAHVAELARTSDSTDGCFEALETVLSRLCTKKELLEFYKRHGLEKKRNGYRYAKNKRRDNRDHAAVLKAARILADPNTPAEALGGLKDVINELSMSAGVSVWDPALVERALTIMFESHHEAEQDADDPLNRKQDYETLHAFLAAIPDAELTATPNK